MSSAIFTFTRVDTTSIIASVEIARYLQKVSGLPIVWTDEEINNRWEVLFIVNGAYGFCSKEKLAALGSAIERAERIVWIQNDYTIIPPKHVGSAESPFRLAFRKRHDNGARPVDFWTSVRPMSQAGVTASGHLAGQGSHYVNWNALAMREVARPSDENGRLVYYGSFRTDRKRYFDAFFNAPVEPTTISSPSRRFYEAYPRREQLQIVDKWDDLYGSLTPYSAGLYIEDRRSHREFMSPANRFYEMLSCGVPMFIEPSASGTLRQGGYPTMREWLVSSAHGVTRAMGIRDKIREAQRAAWYGAALNEKRQVEKIVAELVETELE